MPATENLTYRTEAALLGALLFDRRAIDDVAFLEPADFASPQHQELFQTIRTVAASDPIATGAALAEQVADHLGRYRVNISELHGLALNGPEPSTVANYGRLIMEAAMDRELAGHANRIAAEVGTERGIDANADHLAQLAEAIQFHNRSIDTTAAYIGVPADGSDVSSWDADTSILVQDQILADLIQHPATIGEVATWLDAEVFSNGRREIYETIVGLDQYGEPVDEVTVTWSLSRRSAVAETLQGFDPGSGDSVREQIPPGTVSRLATTAVELGVAVELGRELLTEHVRAEITAESSRVSGLTAKADVTSSRIAAVLGPGLTSGHHQSVTHEQGPHLIQKPPTPELGPDGPKLTW
jgi:hypothetical protein